MKSTPGNTDDTKTPVLVVVVAPIPVTVRRTAVIRVVVPRAAPQSGSPDPSLVPPEGEITKYLFSQLPGIAMF